MRRRYGRHWLPPRHKGWQDPICGTKNRIWCKSTVFASVFVPFAGESMSFRSGDPAARADLLQLRQKAAQ